MDSISAIIFQLVVGILLIVLFCSVFIQSNRTKKLVDKIPGPTPLPIIGNALAFNVDRSEFMRVLESYAKRWKKLYRFWLLDYPYVVLFHPETIAPILTSNIHINKSREYKFLSEMLGNGLITINGEDWKARRKLLTPAFHFRILEGFIPIFNRHGSILAMDLEKYVDKKLDISPFCSKVSLAIICEAAMDYQLNPQNKKDFEYSHAVDRMQNIVVTRMLSPWYWPKLLFNLSSVGREFHSHFKVSREFSEKIINEKKSEWHLKFKNGIHRFQSNGTKTIETNKTKAFLDLLLDLTNGGENVSTIALMEEVDTFMMAGHETTAASLGLTLYLLGHHSNIQQKVHEELTSIYGNDRKRPITLEDMTKMKYLDRVIKEQMRIFSTVPFFLRELKEDIMIEGDLIPRGVTVMCCSYLLHRNPEIFPNPEIFDPDRFLPENVKKRHSFAYVPFSGGQRNCIGQKFANLEMKVLLTWILRSFEVESMQTIEELKLVTNITLSTKYGLPVRLSLRK